MVEITIELNTVSNFHSSYNTEGLKSPKKEIVALLAAPLCFIPRAHS